MNISGAEIAPNATPASNAQPFDWLTLASGALSLVNQQRLADTNIKRAKQGLPPIELKDVPGATPTVAVGVEKSTLNAVMIGGLGVLAILGLRTFLKHR